VISSLGLKLRYYEFNTVDIYITVTVSKSAVSLLVPLIETMWSAAVEIVKKDIYLIKNKIKRIHKSFVKYFIQKEMLKTRFEN